VTQAALALAIHESAALCASYCALERGLHGLVGRAAAREGPLVARRYLASAAMAHGWRAGLWEGLLPVSPGLPSRKDLLAEALARIAPMLSPLDDAITAGELVTLLARGLYPAMAGEYELRVASVSEVCDGPLALAAGRAAADVRSFASKGEPYADVRSAPSSLVDALIQGLTPPLH
jgi:hypothetical protein